MKKFSLKRVSCVLAIAGLFTLSSAFAKEPDDADAGGSSKGKPVRVKTAADEETAPPCVLDKLDLSSKQQSQVKEIVSKYDAELVAVWKEFGDRYLETVALEASMLAAIEDGLTESQRKHVRDRRHKSARSHVSKGSASQSKTAPAVPHDALEEELQVVGVSLTEEQEAAADKVNGNYSNHLRGLKREIHGLHHRLVSMEAEKIVDIEKILTEDQLKQLRDLRQTAPVGAKVTARKSDAKAETKTE